VACHSDTPIKKSIIQRNHPILKKVATTIYINSSKYDKSIPMIHTMKLDKYEKYEHIMSTVNLQQYSALIWMTDEMVIDFSLLPFIKVALQRGYHQFKELVVQTPRYYLNPYPLATVDVVPRKDEPSLFKSPTPVPVIHETVIEVQPVQPTNFMFNEYGRSFQFMSALVPIDDISTQPSQGDPMYNFVLNEEKAYQFSNRVGPINDVSTHLTNQPKPKDTMLQRSFFKISNRIPVPTISKETKQVTKQQFMLSNTVISFTNILFREKPVARPVKIETLSEKVEKERAMWMNQLPSLRTMVLPERVDGCLYETVLIAFQPLAYLEYCVRKLMLQLPTWSHTIVCGNENTEMVTNWNLPIQVISLDIDTITEENYNELLLMESFWSLFQGEIVLVYGEESRLLTSSIDGYLIKKYAKLDNGMTVRNKTAMMDRIRTIPPEEGMSEQYYFGML
jgi:hypothetical protein